MGSPYTEFSGLGFRVGILGVMLSRARGGGGGAGLQVTGFRVDCR